MKRGRHSLRRPVVVRAPAAEDLRRGLRAARLDGAPLAALARPRRVPGPPVAHLPPAQRADAEGPVRTRRPARSWRRRPRRCPRRRAASATGTTATPGSATPRSCSGGSTRSASTGRPTTSSTSSPTWPRPSRATSRSCTASTARASSTESTLDHLSRLRGRPPGADRQRRLQPGPARRVGRGPRLVLPPHEVARPPARAHLADPREAGRGGDRALARARPRHLGGARRAEALHLVEADVLGRLRPRRPPRRDPRRPRDWPTAGRRAADEIQDDICEQRRRRPRRVHASTTTPTPSTRRCC